MKNKVITATIPFRLSWSAHWSAFSVLRVCGFCLLFTLAAQVRVPVPGTVIPMTLQAPAVLLAAFVLRPVQALASVGLYLGLGVAGLPLFAPQSLGLAGPTGGYLVGFLVCAGLVSVLRGPAPASPARLFVVGLAGYVGLFTLGVGWNAVWMHDWTPAIGTGLVPFLPKALVEIGFVVALVAVTRPLVRRTTRCDEAPPTPGR